MKSKPLLLNGNVYTTIYDIYTTHIHNTYIYTYIYRTHAYIYIIHTSRKSPSVQPPSTRLAYPRLTSRAIILANYLDNIISIGQPATKGPLY